MKETQKAIEAESDVYAKYDPFGDYKHLSISERSRLISAKTQAYMAGHIAGRSKSLERERELEEALLQIAKSIHAHVDFSDKTYDGDKEAPMDAIGFIQFLGNKIKQTDEFIRDIAKLLGEDDLGFDGKQWTIDDFKDAIKEYAAKSLEEKEKEISELKKEVADLKRQLEKYETDRYDKDDFDGKRDPWDDLGKWANEHTF